MRRTLFPVFFSLALAFYFAASPTSAEDSVSGLSAAYSIAQTSLRLVGFRGRRFRGRRFRCRRAIHPAESPFGDSCSIQDEETQFLESDNFRVFHNNQPELAQQALQIAERTRAAVREKYLWPDAPDVCSSLKCEIHIYPTTEEYVQVTGQPAGSSGHSGIRAEETNASQISLRRIDLPADNPNMLSSILPHEATHTALAGHFGKKHIPRWADEGLAVLSEPLEKVELHLSKVPKEYDEGRAFTLHDLMEQDYPEPRLLTAFYGQSVSLVKYLIEQKDPKTFAQFLRDSQEEGYESALKKHYNIALKQLEDQWSSYAKAGSKSEGADGK